MNSADCDSSHHPPNHEEIMQWPSAIPFPSTSDHCPAVRLLFCGCGGR
jgi:hypothetical protein